MFFLMAVTTWPLEACEAFWFCLRNPVMHTGRTSVFAQRNRKSTARRKLFADLHPDLTFDPLVFQTEEFKPTKSEDGLNAIEWDPGELTVSFHFAGLRRKLDDALTFVLADIEAADHDSVLGLRRVNMKTMAFRVSSQD